MENKPDRQTDIDWFPHLFQTRPFNFLFQFTLARTRTTHADTLRSAGLARTVGRLYAWRVKQCGLSAGDLWRMFSCRTAIKSSAPTVPVVTVKAAILPSTWASELSGEARTSGKLGPSAGRGENQESNKCLRTAGHESLKKLLQEKLALKTIYSTILGLFELNHPVLKVTAEWIINFFFYFFFSFFTVTMYGPLLLQMWMVLFLGTVSEVAVAQVSSARVMRGNFRRDGEVISWMTLFIVVLMGGH